MSGAGAQFMQYGGRDIPIWFCNSFANTFDNLYIFQFGAHVRKFEQQANPFRSIDANINRFLTLL